MLKWIPCILLFLGMCVYIYRSEDTTPICEDKEQQEFLQEWVDKRRRKKGKFYEKVKR